MQTRRSLGLLRLSWLALLTTAGLSGCGGSPEVKAAEHVARADGFLANGQVPEAMIEYQVAIQADPMFGEARRKLADAYLANGELANAYQQYVRAADLLPNDLATQLRTGEFHLAARKFEDAQASAAKALAIEPGNVDAQILRANALAGLNRIEDAIEEIEQALTRSPDRAIGYGSLGAMHLSRGDTNEAEAAFRGAVRAAPDSISARLALANFLLGTGQHAEAEDELRAALALDPTNLLANRALAYFYLSTGQTEDAEQYFIALSKADNAPGAALALAGFYTATGRIDASMAVLRDIIATDPAHADDARVDLSSLLLLTGQSLEAEELVEEVLRDAPNHAEALMAKAELQARAGDLDVAYLTARSATEASPDSARTHFVLGKIHALRLEPEAAVKAFSTALQHDPELVLAQVELAKLHLAAGRLDEAEQMAQAATARLGSAEAEMVLARVARLKGDQRGAVTALAALPAQARRSPVVLTEIGKVALAGNNRSAARAAFDEALSVQSGYGPALAAIVRMDVQDGDIDAARRRIERARSANPENAAVLLVESGLLTGIGDPSGAERAARAAIELDPDSLDAYGVLARFYVTQGRLAEATEQFETLARRQPRSVAVHTSLGVLLEVQGRRDDARAAYEQVMAIDPAAPVAANNLAWILAETGGNLDVALQLAQTAASRMGERPEVKDTLGWIYQKKGLSSLAIPPLKEAVAASPETALFHFHLGLAQAGVGDKVSARQSLQKALDLNPEFPGAAEARKALEDLRD